jgi:hypothetical protein
MRLMFLVRCALLIVLAGAVSSCTNSLDGDRSEQLAIAVCRPGGAWMDGRVDPLGR